MNRRVKRSGLFIALLGALLLSACGDSPGQEAGVQGTAVQGTAVQGTADRGAEDGFFWKTRELEPPSFGEMAVREQVIVEGVSVKIATPPFDYDFEEMEQVIRASSFITDRYNLQRMAQDGIYNAESYQEGDFHDYRLHRSIRGEWKTSTEDIYYNDFVFDTGIDYENYDGINSVYIGFEGIPWEEGLQENIYTLVAEVFGQEPAEYLVYAETEGAKNHGLEEYVKLPSTVCYYFERKMKEGRQDGTWNIEFTMRVDYPGYINEFKCYDGGMATMLENTKYDMSFFSEGNISGWDIEHFSSDMPEYMAIDVGSKYIRNSVDLIVYSESVSDDGVNKYNLFNLEYRQGLEDVPGFECPTVDMEYTVEEREDSIISLRIRFSGANVGQHFNDLNATELADRVLPIMREQISLMCPWVDLEAIGYDQLTEAGSLWVNVPINCLGLECDCVVSVDMTATAGEWMVDVHSIKQK